MAKLTFRYGAMNSSKTLNLLAVKHNYEELGLKTILIKPAIDDRFGESVVKSRAGLSATADYCWREGWAGSVTAKCFFSSMVNNTSTKCILVDECQFLRAVDVEYLRDVVDLCGVDVICYGLRTDFKGFLFEGSKRLMELADSIEEIKTLCEKCKSRKATFNKRLTEETEQVVLGCSNYSSVCSNCFKRGL